MRALALAALLLGCGGQDPPPATGDSGALALAIELLVHDDDPQAYVGVEELAAKHRGKRLKVRGFVEDAPIERTTDGARHRFLIGHRGAKLQVEHAGPLPDRFQPKLEVIVTGTLAEDGTRIATDELVAKCPETYEDGGAPPR